MAAACSTVLTARGGRRLTLEFGWVAQGRSRTKGQRHNGVSSVQSAEGQRKYKIRRGRSRWAWPARPRDGPRALATLPHAANPRLERPQQPLRRRHVRTYRSGSGTRSDRACPGSGLFEGRGQAGHRPRSSSQTRRSRGRPAAALLARSTPPTAAFARGCLKKESDGSRRQKELSIAAPRAVAVRHPQARRGALVRARRGGGAGAQLGLV